MVPLRLPARLRGPLPAWPSTLDALSERWFALAPRVRLLLALPVAAAVVAGPVVAGRAPYGPPVTVAVADEPLVRGQPLRAGDVALVSRPAATVPEGALERLPEEGRLARSASAGAVLTEAHLAEDLAALAGDDEELVALEPAPGHAPGRRLRLVHAQPDGTGRTLTDAARVVAADERLWVAVPAPAAADVAAAHRAQSLVTVLAG